MPYRLLPACLTKNHNRVPQEEPSAGSKIMMRTMCRLPTIPFQRKASIGNLAALLLLSSPHRAHLYTVYVPWRNLDRSVFEYTCVVYILFRCNNYCGRILFIELSKIVYLSSFSFISSVRVDKIVFRENLWERREFELEEYVTCSFYHNSSP